MTSSVRVTTTSWPLRPPTAVPVLDASHGSERTPAVARVSPLSRIDGVVRLPVAATAPTHSATTTLRPTTHSASRTATTATSATDRTASARSAQERRRTIAGTAGSQSSRPATARPSPGRLPTSSTPLATPTARQPPSSAGEAVVVRPFQKPASATSRLDGCAGSTGIAPGGAVTAPPGTAYAGVAPGGSGCIGELGGFPCAVMGERYSADSQVRARSRRWFGGSSVRRCGGPVRGGRLYGRRQSSDVRCEPAIGPIWSMPPSTGQVAPVT